MELADTAVGDGLAVTADKLRFKAGQYRPDRMVGPGIVRPDPRNPRRAFSDAVAVEKGQAELLLDAGFKLEIEWCAGYREQAKRAAVSPSESSGFRVTRRAP